MNALLRWGKFNLVGAMGMVVQLAALTAFCRLAPGHYLYASAAAIELTLLHNFIWHIKYTWRDRRDDSGIFAQLIRFHLSNGLVSMLGNLALMRILVPHSRWVSGGHLLVASRPILPPRPLSGEAKSI